MARLPYLDRDQLPEVLRQLRHQRLHHQFGAEEHELGDRLAAEVADTAKPPC